MMLKTLFKKEFFELFKTKKFLVLPLVFIFFSATSPIVAKLTPEILKNMVELDGMIIELPEPSMTDAFSQLIQNINQIGVFVVLFMATSVFIGDKTKGRLILLLSKPIKRSNIILSKLFSMLIQLVGSIFLGSLFFIPYTQVLFEEFNMNLYLSLVALFIIYTTFLISVSLFAATVSKSYMSSILISIGIYFLLGMLNFFKYDLFYLSPGKATMLQNQLLRGEALDRWFNLGNMDVPYLVLTVLSSLTLSGLFVLLSIQLFKRQEIK